MQAEECFLQFVRIILLIAGLIKAYLIWKYLNKKALGMQTILDQMIKDIIQVMLIAFIPTVLASIKIVEKPYNHYIAIAIGMSRYFVVLSLGWQFFVTMVIRYLSVFNQSVLNIVDEVNVIRTTRLFVGIMSLISTLFSQDYENGFVYAYLMNKEVSKEVSKLKALKFCLVVNLIVLVLVQVKIEIYKGTLDHQNQTEKEEENQHCSEIHFEYKKNSIRISFFIACLLLLWFLYWILIVREEMEEPILGRLRFYTVGQFVILNLVPMIVIKRNPNMYKFFVKQFQCHNKVTPV